MRRFTFIVLTSAMILTGCNAKKVCAPGSYRPCVCADGSQASQLCDASGGGWGSCLCNPAPGAAAVPAPSPQPVPPPASVAAPGAAVNPPAGALLADGIIANGAFVSLDFGKFPKLPPWRRPDGATLLVAKSGGRFTSIAEALRTAAPNSVILVAGGEYLEQDHDWDHCGLVIRKPVTLMSLPGERVVVRPKGGAHTGLSIMASDVKVRGINLAGFSNLGVTWGPSAKRTALADMTVEGAGEGIATMESKLDGLLAFNLAVKGAREIGFHCGEGPCRNWRLEGVTIEMSGQVEGSGADGFAIESGDNFLLVDVTVSGASADGIDIKGTRAVVWGCHVHHVGRNGLKLWQGGDVINTLVHHTGADASLVTEEGRIRILHSVFGYHNYKGPTSYFATLGYDTRGVTQAEIINSVFFNASGGIWVDPGAALTVTGSLFYGNDNGRVLEQGELLIESQNGAVQLAKLGGGNAIVDPLLDEQLRPGPGSPARNRGVRLTQHYPAVDRLGAPRIKGPAPDIGAFEVE